jgi:hypothetical protein
MLNQVTVEDKKMFESKYEYVVAKIQEIYNFEPEDQEQLLKYREFIKNIILMYIKAETIEKSGIGEQ